MAAFSSLSVSPESFRMEDAGEAISNSAVSSASSVTYSSPCFLAMSMALCSTSFDVRLRYGSPPDTLGCDAISRSMAALTVVILAPVFAKINFTSDSPSDITALRICTGSMA